MTKIKSSVTDFRSTVITEVIAVAHPFHLLTSVNLVTKKIVFYVIEQQWSGSDDKTWEFDKFQDALDKFNELALPFRKLDFVYPNDTGKNLREIIFVPVECQNGHKATWYIEIDGLNITDIGVPYYEQCDCPKWDIGQGYVAIGKPKLHSWG